VIRQNWRSKEAKLRSFRAQPGNRGESTENGGTTRGKTGKRQKKEKEKENVNDKKADRRQQTRRGQLESTDEKSKKKRESGKGTQKMWRRG